MTKAKNATSPIAIAVGLGMIFFTLLTTVPLQASYSSEPLSVGVLHSTKYPYHVMMKNSFEMALADINANGGIHGRPLRLIYADDQGDREAGEKAVADLVKKSRVLMLLGAYHSSNAIYIARMADQMGMPLLVSTAADDRVTQRKWKNVFRLNSPAGDYTKGLESFLRNRVRPRSMAIIYENSPYGSGSALRMLGFCRENHIKISAVITYHKERANDNQAGGLYFERLLEPLRDDPPDVIYMTSYLDDAALLVQKIRQLKINALLCGGAGGFTHQKFLDKAGQDAELLLTATLWAPHKRHENAKTYYQRYSELYGQAPDYHGAEAYSALMVAADALARARTLDSRNIRIALARTDVSTPFGPVKFTDYDQFERQNRQPTMVLQVLNNQFNCVWPEELAKARFRPPPGWRP